MEGREKGTSSRTSAAPQSAKKVFFGRRLIASARSTVMTRIIAAPLTLICSKLIPATSFQIPDNLFQLLNLFSRKLLPAQKRRKQFVSRTVIDLVNQLVCFRLLNG